MLYTHSYRGIVWLDLESPTDEDVSGLVKRYNLHPLIGEELRRNSSLAKVEFFEDCVLVVLTLPVRKRAKKGGSYEIVDREIDFVIGKNFLITSRTDTIEQLEYFGKIFDANSILNKDEKIEHAGYLFYYMVRRIYGGMIEDLENIKDSLLQAEERIFSGDERAMVEVLSDLSRELIDIKQTARMHREVWETMVESTENSFFGKPFSSYLRDINGEFNMIHELIANAHELLRELRETNDSLLNSKQNETIKILTLMAFMTFPLSLIAVVFSLPAPNVPIIRGENGWYIIVGCLVFFAALMLWYFRKKRWI